MKLMIQVGILFAVCWASQILAALLPFDFPATVIGMILLFALLLTGVLRVEHIREKSDFLLANMAFFFLPAGVSIINYADLLKSSVLQLAAICVLSTLITFAATAYSMKAVLWLMARRKGGRMDRKGGRA